MAVIIDFNKKRKTVEEKKNVVYNFILNFFKEIEEISDGINIPYFMEAKRFYKEKVKSIKDLNVLYNDILYRNDTKK